MQRLVRDLKRICRGPRHHMVFIGTAIMVIGFVWSCNLKDGRWWNISSGTMSAVSDSDGDGVPDDIDNCPDAANSDQADFDCDGRGDICGDADGDLIIDDKDAFPLDPDNDIDRDGIGGDPLGICRYAGRGCPQLYEACQKLDNCPYVKSDKPLEDSDRDGIGDACDELVGAEPPQCHPKHNPCENPPIDDSRAADDNDGDGVPDSEDNCLGLKNPYDVDTDGDGVPDAQLNTDNDAFGELCDEDRDGDGIANTMDNCPLVHNSDQKDMDCDGKGDVCDEDRDGDGLSDHYEISGAGGFATSPTHPDSDGDGIADGPCQNPPVPPCGFITLMCGPDTSPLGDAADRIVFDVAHASVADVSESWLPQPSWDAGGFHPDRLTVKARLLDRYGHPAVFNSLAFRIVSSTAFEGLAINYSENSPLNDFSFDAGDRNATFKVVTASASEATLDLYAFDFGGSVVISASAVKPDGSQVIGEITLPKDSDRDGLPDAWENAPNQVAAGFSAYNPHSFSASQLDGQADIDTSRKNPYIGDGLSSFNEYRGIVFDFRNTNGSIRFSHLRLDPLRKDLFVRGDYFANSVGYTAQVANILPFSVNYAAEYEVPNGQSAFENANIVVHDVTQMPSFVDIVNPLWEPPNIDMVVVTNKIEPNASGLIELLGLGVVDGYINHPYSSVPRYWTWDTKGASGVGDSQFYAVTAARKTETYHPCLMHYFFNRPYINHIMSDPSYPSDPNWPSSPCYHSDYIDRLDPLSRVEDFKTENGALDKKEDRCLANNKLDGDRMAIDWKKTKWGSDIYKAGVHLSVFDAEADERVENPTIDDAAGLSKDGLDHGEYTLQQVQLHTVLHEMGHAVGGSKNHTSVLNCLMYDGSPDWSRAGYFSDEAKEQILIHNKTE